MFVQYHRTLPQPVPPYPYLHLLLVSNLTCIFQTHKQDLAEISYVCPVSQDSPLACHLLPLPLPPPSSLHLTLYLPNHKWDLAEISYLCSVSHDSPSARPLLPLPPSLQLTLYLPTSPARPTLFARSFRRRFFSYHHTVKHPHISTILSWLSIPLVLKCAAKILTIG